LPARAAIAAESLVASAVAMPSAQALQALRAGDAEIGVTVAENARSTTEVERVLLDVLSATGGKPHALEALLDSLPGQADGRAMAVEAMAGHGATAFASDGGHLAMAGPAALAFHAEALAFHHDAPPAA
jgi:hypothetical protein